jgi:SH3-like domain-containing protein
MTRLLLLSVYALALLGAGLASPACAQTDAEVRLGPSSGLPVPRFASLKFDVVNGRDGPSFEHRVVWEYRRRGLPVLVIAEDLDWWKVRDPAGDEVWIHRRGLDSRKMAVVAEVPAVIRREPATDAAEAATADPGVLLEIKDCRDGWLRVDGARVAGWLPEGAVWGPGCG